MKRVSFHELAERELNDAALYYEQENAGLGFKFLEEVERYIGAIIKTPNAGQRVRGRVRRDGGSCVHFLMRSYTRLPTTPFGFWPS